MDLSDLGSWTDDEVVEALEEIDHGLTDRNIFWIETYREYLDDREELTDRQREVAEDILRNWNERYG